MDLPILLHLLWHFSVHLALAYGLVVSGMRDRLIQQARSFASLLV